MNLIEQIKNELSSAVTSQLGRLAGANEEATGTALGVAVPALLAAISSMASRGDGAQKLASVLSQFSAGSVEKLVRNMSAEPAAVHEQGSDLLSSLLAGSTLTGITNAVSRFAGIAPGVTQKLLSYVMPLLLGAIASRFTGKPINTQGLASMLAAESGNIARALPSGFSLADIPGLAAAGSAAARSAVRGAEAAGSSWMQRILPWAAVAALALVVLWFTVPKPAATPEPKNPDVARAQSPDSGQGTVSEAAASLVPDVTKFSTELSGTFSKLTEALTSVKDAASAEVALPKLQELDAKLDAAKTTTQKLGDAGEATIHELVKSTQAKLKELVNKVLALPGVGEKLKTTVDAIMAKLAELGGE
jgi:hypothetical protein